MSEQFKIGDSVQLKSGGPVMTINRTSDVIHGGWACAWFVGDVWHERDFAADALKPAATASPPSTPPPQSGVP